MNVNYCKSQCGLNEWKPNTKIETQKKYISTESNAGTRWCNRKRQLKDMGIGIGVGVAAFVAWNLPKRKINVHFDTGSKHIINTESHESVELESQSERANENDI